MGNCLLKPFCIMVLHTLQSCIANFTLNPQIHDQPSKLVKFYFSIASLQFETCCTCVEQFPNMNVVATSDGVTEWRCCNQDKHIPQSMMLLS